ncbi:hypothetical protein C1645_742482 [Glomus cerebriforme]|uniref:Uncharacterized protein n=1 Tax=Glomus cerebriforme TaxID=658196 RepID=A0A397S7G6_9GLOM|nr:hypothetical protein C1645_810358 [Glomus cerebriforme]RIA84244.1 hypothetical protein C1645_742482 [Glomus cerebriforme]
MCSPYAPPVPELYDYNGQKAVCIKKYGIYGIIVHSSNHFKMFKKLNGFIIFRSLMQKQLKKRTGFTSHMTGEIWRAAEKDFVEHFNKIALEASLQKETELTFRHFQPRVRPKKSKKKSTKSNSKYLTIEGEHLAMENCESEVNNFIKFAGFIQETLANNGCLSGDAIKLGKAKKFFESETREKNAPRLRCINI